MSSSSCIIKDPFKGRYLNDSPETLSYLINTSIISDTILLGFEFDSEVDEKFLCNDIIDYVILSLNRNIIYTETREFRKYILLRHKYLYLKPYIENNVLWVPVFYGNIIKFLIKHDKIMSLDIRIGRIVVESDNNYYVKNILMRENSHYRYLSSQFRFPYKITMKTFSHLLVKDNKLTVLCDNYYNESLDIIVIMLPINIIIESIKIGGYCKNAIYFFDVINRKNMDRFIDNTTQYISVFKLIRKNYEEKDINELKSIPSCSFKIVFSFVFSGQLVDFVKVVKFDAI